MRIIIFIVVMLAIVGCALTSDNWLPNWPWDMWLQLVGACVATGIGGFFALQWESIPNVDIGGCFKAAAGVISITFAILAACLWIWFFRSI